MSSYSFEADSSIDTLDASLIVQHHDSFNSSFDESNLSIDAQIHHSIPFSYGSHSSGSSQPRDQSIPLAEFERKQAARVRRIVDLEKQITYYLSRDMEKSETIKKMTSQFRLDLEYQKRQMLEKAERIASLENNSNELKKKNEKLEAKIALLQQTTSRVPRLEENIAEKIGRINSLTVERDHLEFKNNNLEAELAQHRLKTILSADDQEIFIYKLQLAEAKEEINRLKQQKTTLEIQVKNSQDNKSSWLKRHLAEAVNSKKDSERALIIELILDENEKRSQELAVEKKLLDRETSSLRNELQNLRTKANVTN